MPPNKQVLLLLGHIYSVEMTFSPQQDFWRFTDRKKTIREKSNLQSEAPPRGPPLKNCWDGWMEVGVTCDLTFDSSIKGRKKRKKSGGI